MELYRVRNSWYEWSQADSIAENKTKIENNEISLVASISFRRIKFEHLSQDAREFSSTLLIVDCLSLRENRRRTTTYFIHCTR